MYQRIQTTALLLAGMLFFCQYSPAQNGSFDVDAYQAFLASHKDIKGGDILNSYPAPLFLKKTAGATRSIHYLDSIRAKYSLTQDEMDLLVENGFVVTERSAFSSFGDLYLDVWQKDLPVFVTTDAILHALHRSYVKILENTEESILSPSLKQLLDNIHRQSLPALDARYASDPRMKPMLEDVDVYISVGRSLLAQSFQTPFYASNEKPVREILDLIKAESPANYPLFSYTPKLIDFSQFTLRGHYKRSPSLPGYFRAMIWLGRTEFMLTKPVQPGLPPPPDEDIQRQIIASFLIAEAITEGSNYKNLKDMDEVFEFLIGESDNVTIDNLIQLKQETGFQSADELLDNAMVEKLHAALATKPFAGQRINSQILMSDPMSPEQIRPPTAFLLIGQRYIPDSYILGNVVYDRIIHNGMKVPRMLPSSLDILFALGNNAAAQLLQDQLSQYQYAPNLNALRYLVDSYEDEYWNGSLYLAWLNAIRALNSPERIEEYPPFMQTAAWWQQKMNTQLASWSQLRHDNLLYAKQSYSGSAFCSYPEGYVEPIPEFYRRLAEYGRKAGSFFHIRGAQSAGGYFKEFAATMDTLKFISIKELAVEPLSEQEANFIQKMLFERPNCIPDFDGWYHRLFYNRDTFDEDFIVADIHTAPTDETGAPVGWVFHAGTGKINLGIILAPSANGETTAYAGAMTSYYEHITTNFKRLNDEEWSASLSTTAYPRPVWVNNYLADAEGKRRIPGPGLYTMEVSGDNTPLAKAANPVLHSSFPNPFAAGSSTLLSFTLADTHPAETSLEIYDITGRRIRTLLRQSLPGGTYFTRWDGRTDNGHFVSSGVYVCRLISGSTIQSRHIICAK